MKKRISTLFILLILTLSLTACGWLAPHKRGIQQGNLLDIEAVEQLQVGMSQSQVLYLLGTPLLTQPGNPNQWDYVYQLRRGEALVERKHLRIQFVEDGSQPPRVSEIHREGI